MRLVINNIEKFYTNKSNDDLDFLTETLIQIMNSNFDFNLIRRKNSSNNIVGIKSQDLNSSIEKLIKYYIEYLASKNDNFKIINEINIKNSICFLVNNKKVALKFQTANWALIYKDFLDFNFDQNNSEIELVFYVVPCGNLSRMLSAGTVSYSKVLRIFHKYSEIIKKEIIVLGLDNKI